MRRASECFCQLVKAYLNNGWGWNRSCFVAKPVAVEDLEIGSVSLIFLASRWTCLRWLNSFVILFRVRGKVKKKKACYSHCVKGRNWWRLFESKRVGIVLLKYCHCLPLSVLMRLSSAGFNPQTHEGLCVFIIAPLFFFHFIFASAIILVAE